MKRQCCAVSSEMLLYPPVANAYDLREARTLAIALHRNAVECGSCPLYVIYCSETTETAMHCNPAGRLAVQIKIKRCMLVFVLSIDASGSILTM